MTLYCIVFYFSNLLNTLHVNYLLTLLEKIFSIEIILKLNRSNLHEFLITCDYGKYCFENINT